MPRLAFVVTDGTEIVYELSPRSVLRIGRDPENDAVLRDPKVSRCHAEIRFEKGFYVLHDLSSANGSYINGKRVTVAPLMDGARIRLGNSIATFVSDPPEPEPDRPTSTAPFPSRRTAPALPDPDADSELGPTLPHEKPKRNSSGQIVTEQEPDTEDLNELLDRERQQLRGSRFYIAVDTPAGESGSVSSEASTPLLYFHAPGKLIGIVAAMVAAIVTLGGLAATAALAAGFRFGAASAALVLTAAFTAMILLLVPRRHLLIFRDQEMKKVAMTIRQDSLFAFPHLRFSAAQPDGATVGFLEKNSFSNLGRRRWWVFDRERILPTAYAVEDSWVHALARKLSGNLFSVFRTDFRIYLGSSPAGWISRREPYRHSLDLSEDSSFQIDRRMGIALAVVISTVEP